MSQAQHEFTSVVGGRWDLLYILCSHLGTSSYKEGRGGGGVDGVGGASGGGGVVG